MKNRLKRILFPIRDFSYRLAHPPRADEIFSNAAAFLAADKISGDYYEFGTAAGNTLVMAYRDFEREFKNQSVPGFYSSQEDSSDRRQIFKNMRFFAFDSFEGLPEPVGLDKQSLDFKEGKFATTIDQLKKNLRANKVSEEKVHIIKGWFDDILNKENLRAYQMDKAILIHVDVDYYQSAKTVLEFVTPLLQNGTVIVFDDWYNYRGNPELGEQRAFREWLEEHDEWIAVEYHKSGPWRNSFIVNRRSSGSG